MLGLRRAWSQTVLGLGFRVESQSSNQRRLLASPADGRLIAAGHGRQRKQTNSQPMRVEYAKCTGTSRGFGLGFRL